MPARTSPPFLRSPCLVVGAAELGVETSYWYYADLKLQATADAAAYAGALEKIQGSGGGHRAP